MSFIFVFCLFFNFIYDINEFLLQHLKEVVFDILRQSLGNKFTSEVEDAWTKTIDTAYSHVFKGLSS